MEESQLIDLINQGKIFDLLPSVVLSDREMKIDEMKAIFNAFGSFWQYEGRPSAKNPHALLKSGRHSNGFIVANNVLKYPWICEVFAKEMIKKIEANFKKEEICEIGVVASSAYSAINLGWEVTRLLSYEYNPKIYHVIVEKDKDGKPTIIRGGIDPDKTVLVINELMTTADGSTWETKTAVSDCNKDKEEKKSPKVLDKSFVLIHRSKDFVLADNSPVIPVFHFDIENYKPEECPYCQVGSKAIKPKLDNNWDRLHGRI